MPFRKELIFFYNFFENDVFPVPGVPVISIFISFILIEFIKLKLKIKLNYNSYSH